MKRRTVRHHNRFAVLRPCFWNTVTRATVALRLTAAVYILWNPLWGMLASFFMDWFDSYLLIQRAGISRKAYHVLDKNIDQFWSAVMLLYGFTTPYWGLLSVLYIFRLAGHAVYIATGNTKVFLLFPNVFEFAFFWFVALAPWSTLAVDYVSALMLLVLVKLVQEYALHWAWPVQLDRMKHNFRGYHPALRVLGWRRLGI